MTWQDICKYFPDRVHRRHRLLVVSRQLVLQGNPLALELRAN
jgi:hypothetical protein